MMITLIIMQTMILNELHMMIDSHADDDDDVGIDVDKDDLNILVMMLMMMM